jgi:AraC-like DNA-binding protein
MSLQKLTELEQKTNELLDLDRVTYDDLDGLTKEQLDHFQKGLSKKINNTQGEELDRFMTKVDSILSEQTKNALWENNHRKIIQEITTFIDEFGRMPMKIDLAQRVGLSRQTLHKHLKEYNENILYSDHMETFRFMTEKLIAKMFQFAIRGDVKAGRLYFEMIGHRRSMPAYYNQNNYIQVKNLIISEEKLNELTQDQLDKLEEILFGKGKICN